MDVAMVRIVSNSQFRLFDDVKHDIIARTDWKCRLQKHQRYVDKSLVIVHESLDRD